MARSRALALALLALAGCDGPTPDPDPAGGARAAGERPDPGPAPSADEPFDIPAFDPARAEEEDARVDEATRLIAAGNLAAAREILEEVLAEKPALGWPRLLLGLSFHEQKLYERARPHFEAVIAGGPTFERYAHSYYYYGWCLYHTGDLALARRAFLTYEGVEPSEGDTQFALGLIALEENQLDRAEERLVRATELFTAAEGSGRDLRPDVAKAHARLADVALARDDPERAKEELLACVRGWPAHYTAWYKLFQVHTLLGEEQAAGEALRMHGLWKQRATGAGR